MLISRAEQRPLLDVWPIALDQPLPTVPIPLLAEDADLPLDLQAALDSTYDLLGYDLMLDYREPPDPPLDEVAAGWAAARLRAAGIG